MTEVDRNSNNKQVFLFAKWPICGHVKTRMAAQSSKDFALDAYLDLYAASFETISTYRSAAPRVWFDQPFSEAMVLSSSPRFTFPEHYAIQQGACLGERMANAFEHGLERAERVVIIGSDCPIIDHAYLNAAFKALEDCDIVLGPAEDGGYVLIGASRFDARLFDDVAWGGAQVLAKTVENAARAGLTYQQLDMRWDVDNLSDLERWRAR